MLITRRGVGPGLSFDSNVKWGSSQLRLRSLLIMPEVGHRVQFYFLPIF